MLDLILEVCDELRVGIVVLELLEVLLELPKALLIALLAEPDLVAVQPDLLAVLPVEQVDVEARKCCSKCWWISSRRSSCASRSSLSLMASRPAAATASAPPIS